MITYGASETNIPTIGNTPEDITTDTCGVPYPAISLKISDEGEMLIKSPYMMVGYFRDEEATKEAFDKDGWFRTGDIGSIDEKGHVHVTGRLKENIVLATGKKIAPDDIEEKYSDLPGVKELVICGVPVNNADYDEVQAFVVPERLSAESLEKYAGKLPSAALRSYKICASQKLISSRKFRVPPFRSPKGIFSRKRLLRATTPQMKKLLSKRVPI